jgi:hypothetical protein
MDLDLQKGVYQPLQKMNTLSFAADQVITDDSEDNLQIGVFTLQNIANNVGMEISPEKSKMMAFLGQDPLWITHAYNTKRILNILVFKFPVKVKS